MIKSIVLSKNMPNALDKRYIKNLVNIKVPPSFKGLLKLIGIWVGIYERKIHVYSYLTKKIKIHRFLVYSKQNEEYISNLEGKHVANTLSIYSPSTV